MGSDVSCRNQQQDTPTSAFIQQGALIIIIAMSFKRRFLIDKNHARKNKKRNLEQIW
jgi:hypothetical protein